MTYNVSVEQATGSLIMQFYQSNLAPTVRFDMADYMTNGPGRYATVDRVPFVEDFFEYRVSLQPGTYTVAELIAGTKGITVPIDAFDFALYNYELDYFSADFAQRAAIFGSDGYRLTPTTIFVVGADGALSLENAEVRKYDDNFDAEGGGLAGYLGLGFDLLFPGTRVEFEYRGTGVVSASVTRQDYARLVAGTRAQTSKDNQNIKLPREVVMEVYDEYSRRRTVLSPADRECFDSETSILMFDGTEKRISEVRIGDKVASFDSLGSIVPGKVSRLYQGNTNEFFRLDNGVYITPGHRVLTSCGSFATIAEVLNKNLLVVDASGLAKRIRGTLQSCVAVGENLSVSNGAALAFDKDGSWETYNFEVDIYHTYIAGGIRVHNDSFQVDQTIFRQIVAPGIELAFEIKDGAIVRSFKYDRNLDGVYDDTERTIARDGVLVTATYAMGPDGRPNGKVEHRVSYGNKILKLGEIGGVLGSTIGSAIAGKDQFAQIAAGSVLSAALQNVGQSIDTFFAHGGREVVGDGKAVASVASSLIQWLASRSAISSRRP